MHLTNKLAILSTALVAGVLCIPQGAYAQDRDNGYHDYGYNEHARRLDPGTPIPVRADQPIDSREGGHMYRGFVTDDVRGDNGRVVIPAGSPAELTVRVMPDNDLRLALVSVTVRGERYRVDTDPRHVEANQPGGVIGGIVGALSNGQIEGREVHIPRDAVLTFRLEQPLVTARPDYNRDQYR